MKSTFSRLLSQKFFQKTVRVNFRISNFHNTWRKFYTAIYCLLLGKMLITNYLLLTQVLTLSIKYQSIKYLIIVPLPEVHRKNFDKQHFQLLLKIEIAKLKCEKSLLKDFVIVATFGIFYEIWQISNLWFLSSWQHCYQSRMFAFTWILFVLKS